VALQRLDQINGTVVKIGEITEPLAFDPPRLVSVDFNDNILKLVLDRAPSSIWVSAFMDMGSYSNVLSAPPQAFTFRGKEVILQNRISGLQVQQVVDHFKPWLPRATAVLKSNLEAAAQQDEARRREQLELERRAEEERLSVLRTVRI